MVATLLWILLFYQRLVDYRIVEKKRREREREEIRKENYEPRKEQTFGIISNLAQMLRVLAERK